MEVYKLKQPIEFDGEMITELRLDLDGLTAIQLESAEKQARLLLGKKENMFVPETNKKYLACVAAKAAGVMVDLVKSLKAKDYTQVTLLVQNFLLDGDSDSDEETTADAPIPASSETLSTKNGQTAKTSSTESQAD